MGAEFPRRAARAHQWGERAGRAVRSDARARARAASIGLGLPAHVATCVAQRCGGSLPSRPRCRLRLPPLLIARPPDP